MGLLKLIEGEARRLESVRRLHSDMVRVKILGRTDLLPNSLQEALVDIEKSTKNSSHHFLNVAIAYTGRAEIVDATKKIIEDVNGGVLSSQHLDEATFMKSVFPSP